MIDVCLFGGPQALFKLPDIENVIRTYIFVNCIYFVNA